jgi:streptogramin lyase
LYFTDLTFSVVRKVDTSGNMTVIAGTGTNSNTPSSGPATSTALGLPAAIAIDPSDNVYIVDQQNNVILKVSNGTMSIVTAASGLDQPGGIAVDPSGNLYIADAGNNVIREVSGGVMKTIAGTGNANTFVASGKATSVDLSGPFGVAVDNSGDVYIADTGFSAIRRVDLSGALTTVAGNGNSATSFVASGVAANLVLGGLESFAIGGDAQGNLYFQDYNSIRKVDPSGNFTTVTGNGTSSASFVASGTAANIAISAMGAYGIGADAAGNLYFADAGYAVIREIDRSGNLTSIAGNGTIAGSYVSSGTATAVSIGVPDYNTY